MAAVLENVRRPTRAEYPRLDVQRLVKDHLGLPEHVRQVWQGLVQRAVEGKLVEQLHAERGEYQAIVAEWVAQLDWFVEFCRGISGPAPASPLTSKAERALNELRVFEDGLFARWQTLDDLYEIVVEQYRLPVERLSAWVAANPPPQSWYDETSDPFEPTRE